MVDAGAPELFIRFAAGGAQMKEDVALRDFLDFILIPLLRPACVVQICLKNDIMTVERINPCQRRKLG